MRALNAEMIKMEPTQMEPIQFEEEPREPMEQEPLEEQLDTGPIREQTFFIGPDGVVETATYRPDKRYETR